MIVLEEMRDEKDAAEKKLINYMAYRFRFVRFLSSVRSFVCQSIGFHLFSLRYNETLQLF